MSACPIQRTPLCSSPAPPVSQYIWRVPAKASFSDFPSVVGSGAAGLCNPILVSSTVGPHGQTDTTTALQPGPRGTPSSSSPEGEAGGGEVRVCEAV